MKNNKLVPIILVSLSCILFIVAIVLVLNTNHFTFSNRTGNEEKNQNQLKENNNTKQETNTNQSVNTNTNSNSNQEINTNSNTESNNLPTTNVNNTQNSSNTESNSVVENKVESNTTATNNSSSIQTESVSKSEADVISYFESQDNMISKTTNQDDSSLREKVKNAFVTVVDFIFYDKEIKGYTFKELTTSAKLKVIKLALSIDNKIDEYFPDYKEVIKDKYENIKGKLAVKYLEFTSTLCETVGEDTCNQAKEDFNTMKENFSITWQLIKELASSGSSKVKEFYESWRDSE